MCHISLNQSFAILEMDDVSILFSKPGTNRCRHDLDGRDGGARRQNVSQEEPSNRNANERSMKMSTRTINSPKVTHKTRTREDSMKTPPIVSEQEWEACKMEERELSPGDAVLLYTDGVTESLNGEGEEFGEERLLEAARQHRELSLTELLAAVADQARTFSPHEQADDITLIVGKNAHEAAAPSAGASRTPLGGIRQHKQVQTGEKLQGERDHRQQSHRIRVLLLCDGDDVDDHGHCKGHGQPAVGLPNPFAQVQ
jgi:Stage II sporulation protein E (SpoIIE)